MPLYTYACGCGNKEEHLVQMDFRDGIKLYCRKCNKLLKRIIDKPPALHGAAHQMHAIMNDGTKVAGHFGKEAPRLRKKE